ncbi:TPA: hypothetical protein ACGXKN_005120 [Bacillus cereus]
MKNKLAMVFLSAAIVFPTLATIAQAASFSTTFDFTAGLTGPYRSFPNAKNINVDTTSQAATKGAANSTFTVSLQRQTWYGYTTIGTTTHPRNGSKTSNWTNVGSGDYRIYLEKAADSIRVKGEARIYD